ncbi:hypothetical protein N8E89_00560 [Phyllobacterium sp. A18/5-2]|uniref:hypothetical protein n=1 Tax=Phyllobacterium sp. A18/5-2 TaxID=2978392 RepID=UPI0021C5DA1F|nr:hypothetical protein [Phyllobacterium sp. A18/5-2]UXN64416.1 hypothetical protein N8E89_00560 [Phyllobacterium sp. A18/5-2]
MSKIAITNNRPGGFGIPGGPVIAGNGGTVEVDQGDWDGVKDHPVVKAWLDADHLTVSGAKAEKRQAPSAGDGDEAKSVLEVLAMANATDVPFMSFKSAAAKLLGDKTPAKKDEIIAALEELATQP